jgi:glycosyltransferase involved in cell wall biosynthesis
MAAGPGALYLCYFGLREPLVQTQVLPYLRELVDGGMRMALLTFEPELRRSWSGAELREWRDRLREDGIEWHALPYHKRPSLPATLYDIIRGAFRAARLVRRERLDILHARSHVAAAMGALASVLTRARLIFDFRGFLAEEYVDSGHWRANGVLYRLTKTAERWLLRASDGFVVLTQRGRAKLLRHTGDRPVAVIPCCVDEQRFEHGDREAARTRLGLSDRTVYVYLGTLGGFYMTAETAALFAAARELDPRAYLLVVTKSAPERIVTELNRLGVPPESYRVLPGSAEDVPAYLHAADVGLSLIAASDAREAASPTKFAEYLAAGLPVISSTGVGDLDAEIEGSRVGVLLRDTEPGSLAGACRDMETLRADPRLAERCRDHARTHYGLRTVGGERYRRLYQEVLRSQ